MKLTTCSFINDIRVVEDVFVLTKFDFPTDHKICRARLAFEQRIKYRKYSREIRTKKRILYL